MTPGRKFSTTTSASAASFRKISRASFFFRFSVIDFLFAFCARKLVPISSLFSFGTLPSLRARSPSSRVLDLDHLGAEEREVERRERPRENVREVEDANAVERLLRHAARLYGLRRRRDRPRPVDASGHLAPEERRDRARDLDQSTPRSTSALRPDRCQP